MIILCKSIKALYEKCYARPDEYITYGKRNTLSFFVYVRSHNPRLLQGFLSRKIYYTTYVTPFLGEIAKSLF